MTRWKETD